MDEKTKIRNANARFAQEGASNPVALINYLHRTLEDFRTNGIPADRDALRNDPAMRLIVHQLAHLFNVLDIGPVDYETLMDAVKVQHEG